MLSKGSACSFGAVPLPHEVADRTISVVDLALVQDAEGEGVFSTQFRITPQRTQLFTSDDRILMLPQRKLQGGQSRDRASYVLPLGSNASTM